MIRACALAAFLTLIAISSAGAQDHGVVEDQDEIYGVMPPRLPSMVTPGNKPGSVATSSIGQVGQRQTREEVAPNIQPTARISNRVNNRVQNRLSNRIDRYYDPQANTTSPFAVAEEESRTSGGRR